MYTNVGQTVRDIRHEVLLDSSARAMLECQATAPFDNGIVLKMVNAYHRSKWCSHGGAVGKKGHDGGNYALFRCRECGQIVDADRKASLAMAVKCPLEWDGGSFLNQNHSFQISSRRVPANGLISSSGSVLTDPRWLFLRCCWFGKGRRQAHGL